MIVSWSYVVAAPDDIDALIAARRRDAVAPMAAEPCRGVRLSGLLPAD